MRIRLLVASRVMLLVTAGPSLFPETLGAQGPRHVQVTAVTTNVRQGPGTNQPIIGTIRNGTILEVVRDANPWFEVRLPPALGLGATSGYVHNAGVVSVRVQPDPQRVISARPPPDHQAVVDREHPDLAPSNPKDPSIARNYALYLPGGGYLYTQEYGRAGAAISISVIGLYNLLGELGCSVASNSLLGADTGCSGGKKLLWLAATVAPYVYGIIDAPSSASRANEKMRGVQRAALLITAGPMGTTHFGVRADFR